MPAGRRGFHSATVLVTVPSSVPPHMRPRMRELTSLTVPHADRRQGLATSLMERVVREADCDGIVLLITVKPYDEEGISDVDALQAFYAKFGFTTIQPNPVLMARQPVPPPRPVIDLSASIHSALH